MHQLWVMSQYWILWGGSPGRVWKVLVCGEGI